MPKPSVTRSTRAAILICATAGLLAACASAPVLPPPSELPLSKEAMMLLGRKGMTANAPIFVRIFKEESELEIWKQREDGRFYHFKTYPVCNWSGELGPKIKQGDKQAPEGFYTVALDQLNPNSSFYLSYNLGFPNGFDRAHNRTGDFLMVHGKCKSAGCYAMTDALMEEIYAISRDALRGGQPAFQVHAFPFRMTDANMQRHARNNHMTFWQTLKPGYDAFEANRIPPEIAVCEKRYVADVVKPQTRPAPDGPCPRFERPFYTVFVPLPEPGEVGATAVAASGPSQAGTAGFFTAATAPAPQPIPALPPPRASSAGVADPTRMPLVSSTQRAADPARAVRSGPASPMNALGLGAN